MYKTNIMSSYGTKANVERLECKDLAVRARLNTTGSQLISGGSGSTPPATGQAGDLHFIYNSGTATVDGVYISTGGSSWAQIAQMNGA